MADLQLIKEGFGMSTKRNHVEVGTFVDVLDESVNGWNYEKDVLLRSYIEARVIKRRNANSLCRWGIFWPASQETRARLGALFSSSIL